MLYLGISNFYFTAFVSEILCISLHYIYLTALVTFQIKISYINVQDKLIMTLNQWFATFLSYDLLQKKASKKLKFEKSLFNTDLFFSSILSHQSSDDHSDLATHAREWTLSGKQLDIK